MNLLGYVTITDYDKLIDSYEAFLDANKSENIWSKYNMNIISKDEFGANKDDQTNQVFIDLYKIYSTYVRNVYYYNNVLEQFKKDMRDCQKYQSVYNQRFKLFYDNDDFCVINFGSFNFIIFDKTYLKFEYLKNYYNIPVNQIMSSYDSTSQLSLIPHDIANTSILEQELRINKQKELLDKIAEDINDVKDAKTAELSAIQKEIDEKVAELNLKRERLLAELNEKKSLLNQKMLELQNQLFMLETEIYAIRCFLGETVEFIKLKSGTTESSSTPIILFQKIKFLDEELGRLVSLYDVDFEDKYLFEKYLL